jgi:hypothetical protein
VKKGGHHDEKYRIRRSRVHPTGVCCNFIGHGVSKSVVPAAAQWHHRRCPVSRYLPQRKKRPLRLDARLCSERKVAVSLGLRGLRRSDFCSKAATIHI